MPSDTRRRLTSTSRDLPDLLDAVLDGHRGAWTELIDTFDPLVTSILRRYRLRPSDLEDLRQEVWVSVLLHLQELREPRAFPGWIATMTRHEAVRWCTSARRRGEPTDALLIGEIVRDAPVASIDDNLVRTEIRSSVRNGLRELPAADRKLMLCCSATTTSRIARSVTRWGSRRAASDRPERDAFRSCGGRRPWPTWSPDQGKGPWRPGATGIRRAARAPAAVLGSPERSRTQDERFPRGCPAPENSVDLGLRPSVQFPDLGRVAIGPVP